MVNYATVHPKDIDTSKLTELDLNVYTIDLFDLPAGGVGCAWAPSSGVRISSRIPTS